MREGELKLFFFLRQTYLLSANNLNLTGHMEHSVQ